MTLKLLWQEYCEKCNEEGAQPCSYSTFTRGYDGFANIRNYTSRIKHRPGETLEVDWAGPVMYYTNPDNGKNTKAYLFVAALAYSQYVYVEATNSMSEKDWLSCHVNLFRYLGGTPIKIVCDNLRTAVTAHPYKGQIEFSEILDKEEAILNENLLKAFAKSDKTYDEVMAFMGADAEED